MAIRQIKYRLYPTRSQEATLSSFMDLHCELYNAALEERINAYKIRGMSLSYIDQQNELPELKRVRPDLMPLGAHALQETLRRLDRAFKAFFDRAGGGSRRNGFPKFKSPRDFHSFTYPDRSGWKLFPGKIRIANVGLIRMRGKARVEGRPLTCTILRKAGKWYALIAIECEPRRRCCGVQMVGARPGLEPLITLSCGIQIPSPNSWQRVAGKLRSEQRKLGRKKPGSRRYEKQRQKVARLHEKLANIRNDYLHKVSAFLATTYAGIAIERWHLNDLMTGCVNRRQLNRSLADAALGRLYQMLKYKCEEAGTRYVEVEPKDFEPDRTCCRCGAQGAPAEIMHVCKTCGLAIDSNLNAAINIQRIVFGSGTGPGVEGATSVGSWLMGRPAKARSSILGKARMG